MGMLAISGFTYWFINLASQKIHLDINNDHDISISTSYVVMFGSFLTQVF